MPRPKLKSILKNPEPGPVAGGGSRERDSAVLTAVAMNRRGSVAVNEVGISPLTSPSRSSSVEFVLAPEAPHTWRDSLTAWRR